MKVDNHHPLRPGQIEPRDPARQPQGASSPADEGAESATQTHLRHSAADASQDIDTARVDEIREAIRDGRLELDPERIADGLLASVQDLLGQRSEGS
ncbi:flagellar biosynthesis anti-sigma factor FlgM [Halomonas koreensis]|uniref:Negative regulator of flagellin synthesis n=1 Tax=Halomonas koreensis TaxID=245385 RepID=A0ABU1G1W6_9GAMM|nr:flagellar biosynthesis anti-sigma factor FlgM [Halomonas koreensis]MDR5866472.1 flagellar biosynthesis anti-sigma factor FlgM [Halomonas koreensis]